MTPDVTVTVPDAGGAKAAVGPRSVLSARDYADVLPALLRSAAALKDAWAAGRPLPQLPGRSALLLFEKPSTRTRVSFEVGLARLGIQSVVLGKDESQLGRGESLEDTALVLSRYVDLVVHRAYEHGSPAALAEHGSIPVVNALTDLEHPCQALADLLTLEEAWGGLAGRTLAWVGDGNNVCHSLVLAAATAGMHVRVATPDGYDPDTAVVADAEELAAAHGGSVTLFHDPAAAVAGADAVTTDVWTSMGDEDEAAAREAAFAGWTVTPEMLAGAHDDAVFLHCLPAHYGEEVAHEVVHGPQSRVFDQAENRLWTQMALVLWLLAPGTLLDGA